MNKWRCILPSKTIPRKETTWFNYFCNQFLQIYKGFLLVKSFLGELPVIKFEDQVFKEQYLKEQKWKEVYANRQHWCHWTENSCPFQPIGTRINPSRNVMTKTDHLAGYELWKILSYKRTKELIWTPQEGQKKKDNVPMEMCYHNHLDTSNFFFFK